jgi:hypothetical protein
VGCGGGVLENELFIADLSSFLSLNKGIVTGASQALEAADCLQGFQGP